MAKTKLRGELCEIDAGYSEWHRKWMPVKEAWRLVDENNEASSIEFGRQRDVDAFIRALAARGITDSKTYDDCPDSDILLAIAESQAW